MRVGDYRLVMNINTYRMNFQILNRLEILSVSYIIAMLAHVSCSLSMKQYRFAVIFGQPCRIDNNIDFHVSSV